MAYRPALLLVLFCLLLPACRQNPRTNLPLPQSTVISRNLSIAIYRFWSGAVPYCELYFQFTAQLDQAYPVKSDSGCGEQLANLHGCQRHHALSIRSPRPDATWDRIDDSVQPSSHQTCRYQDNHVEL